MGFFLNADDFLTFRLVICGFDSFFFVKLSIIILKFRLLKSYDPHMAVTVYHHGLGLSDKPGHLFPSFMPQVFTECTMGACRFCG